MLLSKVWYYIIGYLELAVIGTSLEKFINLTMQKGILVWDIKKFPRGMKLKMSIKDFQRIRKINRMTDCKVRIVNKKGLPFTIKKIKKRKLLVVGLFFSLVLISYLSTFIWSVDITGNEKISDNEVAALLENNGLEPGVKRGRVNVYELEELVTGYFSEILWTGIELKGTRAIVKIVEKEEEPEILEGPTNMIAEKEAYIIDTMIYSGYSAVQTGDVVKEGDVLIYGRVVPTGTEPGELNYEDLTKYPQTQASGIVKGKVHYIGYSEEPLDAVERERTGESFTRYGFYNNGEVKFWDLKEMPFVEYDKKKTIRRLSLNYPDLELALIIEEYFELEKHEIHREREEVVEIAREEAYDNAKQKIPEKGRIVDVDYRKLSDSQDKIIQIKAVLSVEMDISKEVEIQ